MKMMDTERVESKGKRKTELMDFEIDKNGVLKEYTGDHDTVEIGADIQKIGPHAFEGKGIRKITIPSNVKSIGSEAFKNCHQLEEVILHEGLEKIESCAFERCENLVQITIPQSVKLLDVGAFSYCKGLKQIVVSEGIQKIGRAAFLNCENLEEVTFPKHPVKIDALAFADCRKLNSISIPEGNKTIEPNTFIHCASLKEIEFPDCLTAIENSAFEGCRALEKINLPKDVKKIHVYAFRGCTKLKEIHFSHRLEEIGEYAFDNCQKLEEVVFPDTLKIIEVGAFCNCEGLTLISFPGDIKEVSSDLGVSITEAEDDDFGFDEGFSFSIYRDTRNTLKLKNRRIVVRGSLGEPLKKVLQKNKVMDKVCLPDIECSMAPVAAREATALYILQKQREGSEIPSNILSSYLKYMKAHNIPM